MTGAPPSGLASRLAARGVGRAEPFAVPLTTRFRRVDVRHGVLLAGPAGWAEWSPFDEYGAPVAARWLRAALEAATTPAPPARRDRIELNATVPAVGPEAAAALVRSARCRTVKVKVGEPGQRPEEDLERVAAVREALGPDGRIRVDANGAWDVGTAERRLEALARVAGGLEYAEQPCPTLSDLAALRLRTPVPLAVDEPLRADPAPGHAAIRAAADVVVLKVQPLGGTSEVLTLAAALGLPAVVSSALETSVGLAVGLRTAAALPVAPLACGLGTATLLGADVVPASLRPTDGGLDLAALADVVPDERLLRRARPTGPTVAALWDRLGAALDVLDARDAGDAATAPPAAGPP